MRSDPRPARGITLRGVRGWSISLGDATGRAWPVPGGALVVVGVGTPPTRTLAVVGTLGWRAFTDGTVRPHERTDPDRVAALTRELAAGRAATAPVTATVAASSALAPQLTAATRGRPAAVARHDGTDLAVWVVTEEAGGPALAAALAAAGPATLADGHHRAAAVAAHAAAADLPDDHPDAQVLTAVVAADQLRVAAFHRRVPAAQLPTPLRSVAAAGDLGAVAAAASVPGVARAVPSGPAATPRPGVWIATLGDHHLAVTADGEHRADRSGPHPLDVEAATAWLAALGVPERAIVAVPPTGASEVDHEAAALMVRLAPPRWEDVTACAAAGRTLPAKATFLTPKVPPGLLVTRRADDRPDGGSPPAGAT